MINKAREKSPFFDYCIRKVLSLCLFARRTHDNHLNRFLFAVRKPDRNLCCSLFLCFNFSLLVDGCDPFVFALKGQLPV